MSSVDGSVVGTTKIVDNGPSSERWDLVIMGDGYQSFELGQFKADVQAVVNKLFAVAPFDDPAVKGAINVHRVDVASTDSGADDPSACGGTGTTARTYFDASFCYDGQIQRLLGIDQMTALLVAGAQVPNWNQVMVIVNSTIYGGSGGEVAVFSLGVDSSGNGADETAVHEMGHSAFGLADEYDYYRGLTSAETDRNQYSGSEPFEPNVTRNLDRATIKWSDLIATTTALPTTSNADCAHRDLQPSPVATDTIGAFVGAQYFHCGLYRPQFDCRMRRSGQTFCAVCQREIRAVFALYNPAIELVAGFGSGAGWRVERHPRFMADTTGDRRADIVGFAHDGVWVARAQPGGRFSAPHRMVVGAYGYDGGWRVERHPRFMADTTGDGRADIVGFGDDGVWVSRAQPDGSYPLLADRVLARFGYGATAGGWRVERHPRVMADTTGDGRADIIGFGSAGVVVSRAQPDGSYTDEPEPVVRAFGSSAGGWRVDRHPRFMAATTDSGRADIVGFGNGGVWVSRAQPDGTFTAPELVVGAFGYDAGWRVERHPRFMADTTGDGRADIVGFGDDGVWVSRAQPGGTFSAAKRVVVGAFGYDGGWRVERHPRFMADTTGDGRADIVGFGEDGVWVSRAQPDGSYPLLA
ncbi:MAG TPA: M64 family metallopeptidase, partial [Mycobacterium sp.]